MILTYVQSKLKIRFIKYIKYLKKYNWNFKIYFILINIHGILITIILKIMFGKLKIVHIYKYDMVMFYKTITWCLFTIFLLSLYILKSDAKIRFRNRFQIVIK